MALYGADQNETYMAYESGTYGNTTGTGFWAGRVQTVTPADTQNVQRYRFHNTSSRNFGDSVPGAEDYGFTVEFYPDDMRMLMFALGNITDSSAGSPDYYTHDITELDNADQSPMTSGTRNPFTSFTLETGQIFASGENLINKYTGVNVNSMTLSAEQGGFLTCSAECYAQDMAHSSGGMTLTASEPAHRPYMWNDSIIHVPSGTTLPVKTWELSPTNNLNRDAAHVCNGSRVALSPSRGNRDYTLTLTMDGESSEASRLYGLWKSGGDVAENAAIQLNHPYGSASGLSWISLSGCDVDAFDKPNPMEGINEWSLTLIPQTVSGEINDEIELYKAW